MSRFMMLLTIACMFVAVSPLNAADKPLRILCIGDSITQGDPHSLTWRYDLWKRLVEAKIPVDFVGTLKENYDGTPDFPPVGEQKFDQDHEARWGWTITQVSEGLPEWLESVDAEIALIHLGTNDAMMGHGPATLLQRMKGVVDALQVDNPGMTIFVVQLIPASSPRAIPDFNKALPEAVKAWSTDTSTVLTVDMFTGFNVESMLWDGLHPNADGDEFMGERWFKALTGYLEGKEKNK